MGLRRRPEGDSGRRQRDPREGRHGSAAAARAAAGRTRTAGGAPAERASCPHTAAGSCPARRRAARLAHAAGMVRHDRSCVGAARLEVRPGSDGSRPGVEFAGYGARLVAYILDGILLGVVITVLTLVLVAILAASVSNDNEVGRVAPCSPSRSPA